MTLHKCVGNQYTPLTVIRRVIGGHNKSCNTFLPLRSLRIQSSNSNNLTVSYIRHPRSKFGIVSSPLLATFNYYFYYVLRTIKLRNGAGKGSFESEPNMYLIIENNVTLIGIKGINSFSCKKSVRIGDCML